MSVKAGELLANMKIRLDMQKDELTNPSNSVKKATKSLLEKLTLIDPQETIKIVCGEGRHFEYIRKRTGEVLVIIDD